MRSLPCLHSRHPDCALVIEIRKLDGSTEASLCACECHEGGAGVREPRKSKNPAPEQSVEIDYM